MRELQDVTYRLGVCNVVCHDLGHLWEVPAIPLTHAHGVCVQLLVKVIQQTNRLQDQHHINSTAVVRQLVVLDPPALIHSYVGPTSA
jgi:hypothetical protein